MHESAANRVARYLGLYEMADSETIAAGTGLNRAVVLTVIGDLQREGRVEFVKGAGKWRILLRRGDQAYRNR